MLKVVLMIAILMAAGECKKEIIEFMMNLKGKMKMEKKIEVDRLKRMEKWASFLLSLFPVNRVINASKLVPIFAPKIRGIASFTSIILFRARTWRSATNKEDDWSEAVKRVPIIKLKMKLLVDFFI